MVERLLILTAVAVAVVAGWAALGLLQRRRLRALAVQRPFAGIVPPGRPAVIAFTLPGCGECRARQAPALGRLGGQLGAAVQIVTLSAEAHAALVARLGILTVPTTVVLDADGAVRSLNQGFADEGRLLQQLGAVGLGSGAGPAQA